MPNRLPFRRLGALLYGFVLLLGACGGSDGAANDGASSDGASSGSDSSDTQEDSASNAAASNDAASKEAGAEDSDNQEEAADAQPGIVFVNPDGTEVEITDTSRIVVLNGDLAEVVWALGFGDNVVATDISATYPDEANTSSKIGYQRSLNVEGILSFEPTLVIGNTQAGPPEVIQQVIDAGVPVAILEYGSDIEAITSKVLSVGAALGANDEAAALAADLDGQMTAVLAAAEQTGQRGVFLYFRGADTQLIGGAGSGADAIFAAIGMVDGGAEAGVVGIVPMTPEALVASAPEVIVVTTAGLESLGGIDGLMSVPGIAQTPAAEARRVLVYDDQLLLGFGPRAPQVIEQLATDVASGITFDEQLAALADDNDGDAGDRGDVVLGTDQQEVADAFNLLFQEFEAPIEDRAAVLADPAALMVALEAYTPVGISFKVGFEIADVEMNGDTATVVYSVLLGGSSMASDLRTPFLKTDAGWVVEQTDFCTIVSLARVACP